MKIHSRRGRLDPKNDPSVWLPGVIALLEKTPPEKMKPILLVSLDEILTLLERGELVWAPKTRR